MVRPAILLAFVVGLVSASPLVPLAVKRQDLGVRDPANAPGPLDIAILEAEKALNETSPDGWDRFVGKTGVVTYINQETNEVSTDPPGLAEAKEQKQQELDEAKKRKDEDDAKKKQEDKEKEDEKFCGFREFKTIEDGTRMIDHTRAVWEIDDYIYKTRAEGWLSSYTKDKFGKHLDAVADIGGCSKVHGQCNPGPKDWNCRQYLNSSEEYQTQIGFWAFTLVKRINSKLSLLSDSLVVETLKSSLSMSGFAEDFSEEQEAGSDFFKWLSMAFSLGGILATPNPAVSATFGAASTLFGAVQEIASHAAEKKNEGRPQITTKDVMTKLGEYFSETHNAAAMMLEVGFGATTDTKGEKIETVLPRVRGDGNLRTDIGKWLNNGFWLVEEDQKKVMDAFLGVGADIRRKFVDMRLKEMNYVITADMNHDEKSCKEQGQDGWEWINYKGKDYCFHMMKRENIGRNANELAHTERQPHYDKMARHGFKEGDKTFFRAYYEHLLKCYEHSGNDPNKQGYNSGYRFGDAPTCFYNMMVVKYQQRSKPLCDGGFVPKCRHFDILML